MDKIKILIGISALIFTPISQAGLIQIGTAQFDWNTQESYNLIWDNDDGLLWLDHSFAERDANPYTFRTNQTVIGNQHLNWNLNEGYEMGAITAGINWLVPTITQMDHLYSDELGNGGSLDNVGPFENLLAEEYWSSGGSYNVPTFHMGTGVVDSLAVYSESHTSLIVWNGNIVDNTSSMSPPPPTNVPEPSMIALMGAGFVGLGFARRRRKGLA